MRGSERGNRKRGNKGVEREGGVGVHKSEGARMGFKEERGYARWEGGVGRVGELQLGSFDNNH